MNGNDTSISGAEPPPAAALGSAGMRDPARIDAPLVLEVRGLSKRFAARFLARHPGIPVVIGHLGSPAPADLREGAAACWEGLEALADLEQAYIKISMLSYADENWRQGTVVREAVHRVLDLFGAGRCMFASNYPVEKKAGWPVPALYAGFRELAAHLDDTGRQRLFADTARRAYRVPGRSSHSERHHAA